MKLQYGFLLCLLTVFTVSYIPLSFQTLNRENPAWKYREDLSIWNAYFHVRYRKSNGTLLPLPALYRLGPPLSCLGGGN